MTAELMTTDEHEAVRLAGELAALLAKIVGPACTREGDLNELITPLHTIQNAVLAQAAARAYPQKYRLLGRRHVRV